MQIRAQSIGEAVPQENFEALIQSAFDSAVNLRLADADRLLTLLIAERYELPQGIRIWTQDISLQTLTPGFRAAASGGILRFDSSPLTVDLRGAPIWRCRLSDLHLDMKSAVAQKAWSTAWDLLNREQKRRNVDIIAEVLFPPNSGSLLCRRISRQIPSLLRATERFNVQEALEAAKMLIGLGPGVTPSGDDILIGYLAGLWSMAGQDQRQLAFIRSFGPELLNLARQTSEISRTYLYHAAWGQCSSSLLDLAEAIATGNGVEEATQTAMRVGHSSGMDSVTGLLIGLCASNQESRASRL